VITMNNNEESKNANENATRTVEEIWRESRKKKKEFDKEIEDAFEEAKNFKDFILMNALEEGFTLGVKNDGNQAV